MPGIPYGSGESGLVLGPPFIDKFPQLIMEPFSFELATVKSWLLMTFDSSAFTVRLYAACALPAPNKKVAPIRTAFFFDCPTPRASETATNVPRRRFQMLLKILFMAQKFKDCSVSVPQIPEHGLNSKNRASPLATVASAFNRSLIPQVFPLDRRMVAVGPLLSSNLRTKTKEHDQRRRTVEYL